MLASIGNWFAANSDKLWNLGGALGLGSLNGIFSGISSKDAAKASYKYASRLAAQQFEYNKRMMQHRHQWEVDDLRSAGLNPILSAGGGGASGSTGSGGSVNVQPADVDFTSALSTMDGLQNSSVNRSLIDAQKSAVDVKAAIDREKLAQERMKTKYIKSDPTYFSRNSKEGLLWSSAQFLNKPIVHGGLPSVFSAESNKIRNEVTADWWRKFKHGDVGVGKLLRRYNLWPLEYNPNLGRKPSIERR